MSDVVHQFIAWLEASKYFVLFGVTIVEGPVAMIASGFFLKLGSLELTPTYVALVAGDFAADILWYGVGRFGARLVVNKFGKFFGITPEIISKIEERFKKHQDKILLISKLTMGLGFAIATLVTAGILKVSFKRYIFLNFFGGLIWVSFLLVVGFFFGNVYSLLSKPVKIVFVCIAVIAVIFGLRSINRYLRRLKV